MNAVKRASVPQNVSELRSFLGMVQYYHPFLPGLATYMSSSKRVSSGHGQTMHCWCIMMGTVNLDLLGMHPAEELEQLLAM